MEAISDASANRLRPLLMTSLSTVFGILPIALALAQVQKVESQWELH